MNEHIWRIGPVFAIGVEIRNSNGLLFEPADVNIEVKNQVKVAFEGRLEANEGLVFVTGNDTGDILIAFGDSSNWHL